MSQAIETPVDPRAGEAVETDTYQTTVYTGGPIKIKNGMVILSGAALAMTLAAPTAGADDGKELTIFDLTGSAHTITCPVAGNLNGNGSHRIATFGGTQGTKLTLQAYNGVWLSSYSVTGVTFS